MDGSNIDISTDVELGDMMLPVRDMSQWVITIPKVAFQMNGSKEVIVEHRACIIVDYEGVREIGGGGGGGGGRRRVVFVTLLCFSVLCFALLFFLLRFVLSSFILYAVLFYVMSTSFPLYSRCFLMLYQFASRSQIKTWADGMWKGKQKKKQSHLILSRLV